MMECTNEQNIEQLKFQLFKILARSKGDKPLDLPVLNGLLLKYINRLLKKFFIPSSVFKDRV